MTQTLSHTLHTPDGTFTVVSRDGSVLAAGWTSDVAALLRLVHPTLRPASEQVRGVDGGTDPIGAAVADYYDGDLDAPARVPVLQYSGPFRRHAWDVLRGVPAGQPITYAQFAARADRPAAVRAAAGACAANAAALFVPCHRVLRTDGGLGGFRYGVDIKQRLLAREAASA